MKRGKRDNNFAIPWEGIILSLFVVLVVAAITFLVMKVIR